MKIFEFYKIVNFKILEFTIFIFKKFSDYFKGVN